MRFMKYKKKVIYFICCIINCLSIFHTIAQDSRIDSLRNVLKKLNNTSSYSDDTNKVNALNALAKAVHTNKWDTVLILANQATNLAHKIKFYKGEASAYEIIGNYFSDRDEYSKALNYYNKSLQLQEQLKDKIGIINNYYNIGFLFYNQSINDTAINFFEKGYKISKEINYEKGIIDYYNGMGNVYNYIGNYKSALSYFLNELKYYERIDDTLGLGKVYYNIGMTYEFKQDYSQALKFYLNGLKMDELRKDTIGLVLDFSRIGNIYSDGMNDDVNALSYYKKTIMLGEKFGMKQAVATGYHNVGVIYDNKDDYKTALKYYYKGLYLKKEINYKKGVAISYQAIGDLYLKQHNITQSLESLQNALSIAKSIDALKEISEVYLSLSQVDSARHNWKGAYNWHKLYVEIKDSVYNQESSRQIAEMQTVYETEKKQKQIADLEKDKQIQAAEISKQTIVRNTIVIGASILILSGLISFFFYKRKKDAEQKQKEISINLLASETEMKSLRSQMNPHFIFNALQSIQTFLLNHQSNEANNYLIKFSKLMRAVLENSQYSEVSIQKDIQALELYMQLETIRLTHPFTYEFHLDKTVNVENDTIPPLLLQPFVENAIWHGLQYKSASGHIDIYIMKKQDLLHIIVEDNGIGRNNSNKVDYPALLKKESLGLKLTEERLKLLNKIKKSKANFRIIDLFTSINEPSGTRVEMFLPLGL